MADIRGTPLQQQRYLGLELAGAKNQKTSLAVLEYYPREQKVFLLDIYDRISATEDKSADQMLIETLREVSANDSGRVPRLGVNVPTTLPPCITCNQKACHDRDRCTSPQVKWMARVAEEAAEDDELSVNIREITPYTQRPFEIWARYNILPRIPKEYRFEIDEALGGNRAPLTARMHYLSRSLTDFSILEVWPKLTIATLGSNLNIPKRIIYSYRKPEEGFDARMDLLGVLAVKRGIFIYERDLRKLATSVAAFDAFICAYTALLVDRELTTKPPRGFDPAWGWVHHPAFSDRNGR